MYFRDSQECLKQLEEKKKDSGNTSDQKEDSFEMPIGKKIPRPPVTSTPLIPASSNQSKSELSFESDVGQFWYLSYTQYGITWYWRKTG